ACSSDGAAGRQVRIRRSRTESRRMARTARLRAQQLMRLSLASPTNDKKPEERCNDNHFSYCSPYEPSEKAQSTCALGRCRTCRTCTEYSRKARVGINE